MAGSSSTDRIEKVVILDAPRSRVWGALTDVKQFNAWFGVELQSPFAPGAAVEGRLTFKGYDHLTLQIWIEAMEPERHFSFRWHPFAIDPTIDYSNEPKTLVSFTLEDVDGGTKLTIVESGFDAIPASRRAAAFSSNTAGWDGQARNIQKFLAGDAPVSGGRVAPHQEGKK